MEDWWLMLLAGVLGILIGVFTFARPHLIGSVLVMYIGLRAIMQGLLEIVFAVRLRKAIEGEWLWIFGGAMSLLFGLIMIMFPIEGETFQGLLVIGWLIGIYAIAAGAMQLVLAGQIRDWIKRIQEKPAAALDKPFNAKRETAAVPSEPIADRRPAVPRMSWSRR